MGALFSDNKSAQVASDETNERLPVYSLLYRHLPLLYLKEYGRVNSIPSEIIYLIVQLFGHFSVTLNLIELIPFEGLRPGITRKELRDLGAEDRYQNECFGFTKLPNVSIWFSNSFSKNPELADRVVLEHDYGTKQCSYGQTLFFRKYLGLGVDSMEIKCSLSYNKCLELLTHQRRLGRIGEFKITTPPHIDPRNQYYTAVIEMKYSPISQRDPNFGKEYDIKFFYFTKADLKPITDDTPETLYQLELVDKSNRTYK